MRRGVLLPVVLCLSACGRSGYELVPLDQDAAGGAAVDGASSADATVFTTSDGGEDSYLASSEPDLNFGAGGVLRTASSPAATILVRFDLEEVAAGSVVGAATLTVWTTDAAQDASEVRIYRVFEDWIEGSEIGAAGAASWDLRAPGEPWFSAGCGAGSRDAAARAAFVIDAPATAYQVALPVAVVQAWVDDPAGNFGLALVATAGSGIELASSEHADAARRPSLAIEWSP